MGSRYTSSIAAAPPTAVKRNETEAVSSGRTPPSIPIWGEGFQVPPAGIVPPSRIPSTLDSRPRYRICTLTLEPASPRARKRILLERSEMHIPGLVADAPAGSDSEVLSELLWT